MVLVIGIPPLVNVSPQDPEINIGLNISAIFVKHIDRKWENTGARYEVRCEATGYPQPEITWSKLIDSVVEEDDVGAIPGGFEILIDKEEDVVYHDRVSNSLILKSMRIDDVGAYFCSATNIFGSDAKAVQISITGLGMFLVQTASFKDTQLNVFLCSWTKNSIRESVIACSARSRYRIAM